MGWKWLVNSCFSITQPPPTAPSPLVPTPHRTGSYRGRGYSGGSGRYSGYTSGYSPPVSSSGGYASGGYASGSRGSASGGGYALGYSSNVSATVSGSKRGPTSSPYTSMPPTKLLRAAAPHSSPPTAARGGYQAAPSAYQPGPHTHVSEGPATPSFPTHLPSSAHDGFGSGGGGYAASSGGTGYGGGGYRGGYLAPLPAYAPPAAAPGTSPTMPTSSQGYRASSISQVGFPNVASGSGFGGYGGLSRTPGSYSYEGYGG